MARVEIYTKSWCPYCAFAKAFLAERGIAFTEFDVTDNAALERDMRKRSHRHTVPQIFIDGRHVGGSTDLVAEARAGRLDGLSSNDAKKAST